MNKKRNYLKKYKFVFSISEGNVEDGFQNVGIGKFKTLKDAIKAAHDAFITSIEETFPNVKYSNWKTDNKFGKSNDVLAYCNGTIKNGDGHFFITISEAN